MRIINRVIFAASLLSIIVISFIGVSREEPSQAATVYTIPASIDKTCTDDVTQAINNWIAGVPNNSTIRFQPDGCYKLNRTIQLNQRSGLEIDGQNATFRAGTSGSELPKREARTRSQWDIIRSDNITIKNMTVYGANKNGGTGDGAYVEALEAQHAFNIVGSTNVLVDKTKAYEVYGDFVYIGSNGGVLSENVTVRNGHYEKNGRQGMAITGAKNVLIEKNYLNHTRRSTFDIESNTSSGLVDGVMIKNNTFGPNERLLFFANGGACARNANVTFEGNVLDGRPFEVSSKIPSGCSTTRGPYRFINNTTNKGDGNPGQGLMNFSGIDGLEVISNNIRVQGKRGMRLVRITGSGKNIKVVGNRIPEASGSLLINVPSSVTNYCYSDNMIGSPLTLEPSNMPCQEEPPAPPPDTPDPPENPVPPPASEEELEEEIKEELNEVTPAGEPVIVATKPPTGTNAPRPDGTSPSGSGDDSAPDQNESPQPQPEQDSSNVSATENQSLGRKVISAIQGVPNTLTQAAANPTSIPDLLEDPEKKASLTAFAGITAITSGGLEAGHVWRRRRKKLRDFFKHHNLGAASPPRPAATAEASPKPADTSKDETSGSAYLAKPNQPSHQPGDTIDPKPEQPEEPPKPQP